MSQSRGTARLTPGQGHEVRQNTKKLISRRQIHVELEKMPSISGLVFGPDATRRKKRTNSRLTPLVTSEAFKAKSCVVENSNVQFAVAEANSV